MLEYPFVFEEYITGFIPFLSSSARFVCAPACNYVCDCVSDRIDGGFFLILLVIWFLIKRHLEQYWSGVARGV